MFVLVVCGCIVLCVACCCVRFVWLCVLVWLRDVFCCSCDLSGLFALCVLWCGLCCVVMIRIECALLRFALMRLVVSSFVLMLLFMVSVYVLWFACVISFCVGVLWCCVSYVCC